MKKRFAAFVPYIIILGIDFYLLPLLMRDTGTAMVLMLCAMPFIAFAAAVVCAMRNGFSPVLPAAALLLFIPTVWIHYNSSAWVYAVVYAVIVLAGTAIGRVFYRKR